MDDRQETSPPRVPWWVSAPFAMLLAALFAYFFVTSLGDGDPPWDPPWLAATYRGGYAVLAVLFLLGAVIGLRPKHRGGEMAKPLAEILATTDDGDLCDSVYIRILARHRNHVDLTAISEAERIVVLVWYTMGIVTNGGFRYFFEKDWPGDPDLKYTKLAFVEIEAYKAAAELFIACGVFPDSTPHPNINERLAWFDEHFHSAIDESFWAATDEIKQCLSLYIRQNQHLFAHLE